jgi:hypothetical protein
LPIAGLKHQSRSLDESDSLTPRSSWLARHSRAEARMIYDVPAVAERRRKIAV